MWSTRQQLIALSKDTPEMRNFLLKLIHYIVWVISIQINLENMDISFNQDNTDDPAASYIDKSPKLI